MKTCLSIFTLLFASASFAAAPIEVLTCKQNSNSEGQIRGLVVSATSVVRGKMTDGMMTVVYGEDQKLPAAQSLISEVKLFDQQIDNHVDGYVFQGQTAGTRSVHQVTVAMAKSDIEIKKVGSTAEATITYSSVKTSTKKPLQDVLDCTIQKGAIKLKAEKSND